MKYKYKKFIVEVISFVALLACMLAAIFATAGLCALIWGSKILDTTLGSSPDRTHPAFIFFMITMIPCMLIAAWTSIVGLVIPIHYLFGVPIAKSNESSLPLLLKYQNALASVLAKTKAQNQRVDPTVKTPVESGND